MIANYLRTAFRSLVSNKGYAAISIIGLALSMSVCLLIIAFVKQEWSHDTFHPGADRIYHLYSDFKAGINPTSDLYGTTPVSLGSVLKAEHPDVEETVTLRYLRGSTSRDGERLRISGVYASSNYFDMLGIEIVLGNRHTPLDAPNSIVLSEPSAKRLFGSESAIGKTLQIGRDDFTVTAVTAIPLERTIFDFDVVASFETLTSKGFDIATHPWHRTVRSHFTFVRLREGTEPESVWARLSPIIETHYPPVDAETYLVGLSARPLTAISEGPRMGNMIGEVVPRTALWFLIGLAGLILAAACFNYVGFSVARGLRRMREIGVRKVVGARRKEIVTQFLTESTCVSLAALALSAVVLEWQFGRFLTLIESSVTDAQLQANLSDPVLWIVILAFGLLVGVAAGLYPALYLSRFMPTVILKGASGLSDRGFRIRKTLIVVQCALSLFFITTTILLYTQATHILQTDLGFRAENIINVEVRGADYETLRSELLRHSGVQEVSGLSILTDTGRRNDVWLRTADDSEKVKGYIISVDEHTISNLDIRLVSGRTFTGSESDRRQRNVILNDVAVKRLGLGDVDSAVGKTVAIGDEGEAIVLGVVSGFRYYSRVHDIDPLVLLHQTDQLRYANLRFDPESYDQVAAHIRASCEKLLPGEKPRFGLYSDQLEQSMVARTLRKGIVMISFPSAFLVIIACLGLLGMTAYAMQTRMKEIGVRRVCGATTSALIARLGRSYLVLILIAAAVATPVSAFVATVWLEDFENRILLGPLPFLFGILALLAMGLLTVGSQALIAARANPTDVLRQE